MTAHSLVRLSVIVLSAMALIAAAPKTQTTAEAARTRFAADFVAALKSQDAERIKANYHPAVRACMSEETRAFFDIIVADDLRSGRRLDVYKVAALKPVTGPASLLILPPDGFAYPVAPTHQVQIDAKTGPYSAFVVLRYLAPAAGRWYVVYPCPNARGMAFIAQMTAERARQAAEGRKLLEAVTPELRAEITGLVAEGHLIDAIARYRQATGADDRSAHQVVAAISAEQ